MPLEIRDELIDEMVKRKMAQEEYAPKSQDSAKPLTTLDPTFVSILGPIADAVSTYTFLKRGTGQEENPAFQGMSPSKAAVSVASGGLAIPLLMRALRGHIPQKFTDAIIGNTGAASLGMAASNFEGGRSSYDKVYGLLGNLDRINSSREPVIPSFLPKEHDVALNRAMFGDHRNKE